MNEEVDFLKTPRGKAIIKLGLYFVFFLLIFIFIRPSNTSVNYKISETPLEKYSKMTNYEYTYKYDDTLFEGKVYRDNLLFNLNDQTYYYDGNIYKVINNKLTLDELDENYYIDNHTISNYIEKGNIIGKNEDYENNVTETTYSIDNMHIIFYEKDNLINKVKIEIIGEVSHLIEIDYTNINGVSNFIVDLVKE